MFSRSGLKTLEDPNRLALGTVQFGLPYGIANQTGQVSYSEAKLMLHLASNSGIDVLDTAISYGDSEECLGKIGIQDFKVITKLPALPNNCAEIDNWVQQQISKSLSRLGVTKIYGVLLHQTDQLINSNGAVLYRALQALKDKGQVQKVGISIYSPKELEVLMPRYHFDLVQAPLNLFDQRLSSSGWLWRLKENNIEIHARSAFLQGLLLIRQNELPYNFLPWKNLFCRWYRWLLDNNVSAVEACLAFLMSFPEIDRVVVGADSLSQLAEILSASKYKPKMGLPKLQCDDENLINPAKWNKQ